MLFLVPDSLAAAINQAIDKALNGRPCGDFDREIIFKQVLGFYDRNGFVPSFDLTENTPPVSP